MSDEERPPEPLEFGTERIEAFSDAVMAVIMTIMAFQLQAPAGTSLTAIGHRMPGLLVYVLSFAFIGIYWNNHHHLMRATTRISGAVMWANLFLLFWLSLIPVVTLWLRDYYKDPVPAAVYGVVALCSGFAYNLLVRAIIRANGRDSLVANAIASDLKGYTSLALYAAAVGLAAVSPRISYAIYAGVAVMWIVPDRRFIRK